MQKILFISPYVPVATKSRPHNFILHLAKKYEIYLLFLEDVPRKYLENRKDYHILHEVCRHVEHVSYSKILRLKNCVLSIPSSQPLRAAYCNSNYLRNKIIELIDKYNIDIIHVDRSRIANLVKNIQLPKVLDLTDSITWFLNQCLDYVPLHLRPVYSFEHIKMKHYERTVGNEFDKCLITSNADLKWFEDSEFYNRINVVPNILSQSFFCEKEKKNKKEKTLLFFGNLYYYPNVDAMLYFSKEIFPLIRKKVKDVKLNIVGNAPSKSILSLQKDSNIEVIGYVDDIRSYVLNASIVISPMRIGLGFPNKIAESLAMGKAIVSTYTSCAGLQNLDGALAKAKEPKEFANEVIGLLEDPELLSAKERSARQYAEKHLNPSNTESLLDNVYADLH